MEVQITDIDFLIRLLTAFGLGAVIGFEREFRSAGAGLRTTALVSTGAAMFVLASYYFIDIGEASPSRILAGVVTGVGFLGAGVIFKDMHDVHGLTTAATIWCAAAIGCLSGIGMLMPAVYGTVIVLIITFALRPISKKIP